MPYIIETTTGCGYCTHCGYGNEPSASCLHKRIARTAVATLDEARETARDALPAAANLSRLYECEDIPESGATVGPLPDGTVIEVVAASWLDLLTAIPKVDRPNFNGNAAIIAAFNAERSATGQER